MCKHFISDDRGVVADKDLFDGEGRDLGDENPADGICERGIDAYDGEACIVGEVLVEFYFEVLSGRWSIRQTIC
jgi:hypothetical protein